MDPSEARQIWAQAAEKVKDRVISPTLYRALELGVNFFDSHHSYHNGLSEEAIGRVVELDERSLATSGDYRNFFEVDGQRYSHEIDPRTGRPAVTARAGGSYNDRAGRSPRPRGCSWDLARRAAC